MDMACLYWLELDRNGFILIFKKSLLYIAFTSIHVTCFQELTGLDFVSLDLLITV